VSQPGNRPEINALLNEARVFEPTTEWKTRARVTDPAVYDRAAADPEGFWEDWAR